MKKIQLIKQHDERDCGAACLSMILGYYGRKISVSAAKRAIKVDRNGANIYGIMDGAEQYHLISDAFEESSQEAWDNISSGEYSFPFIIRILNDHVYEHFVVASGIEKREKYPISAWRGIALRMKELIKPNMRVSIKGYLSQKQTDEGLYLEVTAEEFQVAYQNGIIRPLRRTESTQKHESEEKKQIIDTSYEKNESTNSMNNNE